MCLVGVAGGSIIIVGLSLSDIITSEQTAHSDEVVITPERMQKAYQIS